MPENDPQDSEDRTRWAATYLRQRFSITDFLAVFIALPYVLILSYLIPVPLALGIAAAPVWFLLSGNWALIEGTPSASARSDVQRGLIAGNVLLAMAPGAVLVALLSPGIPEPEVLTLGIVLAVAALLHFRVRARRFDESNRSAT
jgi:hypothetical protein